MGRPSLAVSLPHRAAVESAGRLWILPYLEVHGGTYQPIIAVLIAVLTTVLTSPLRGLKQLVVAGSYKEGPPLVISRVIRTLN